MLISCAIKKKIKKDKGTQQKTYIFFLEAPPTPVLGN